MTAVAPEKGARISDRKNMSLIREARENHVFPFPWSKESRQDYLRPYQCQTCPTATGLWAKGRCPSHVMNLFNLGCRPGSGRECYAARLRDDTNCHLNIFVGTVVSLCSEDLLWALGPVCVAGIYVEGPRLVTKVLQKVGLYIQGKGKRCKGKSAGSCQPGKGHAWKRRPDRGPRAMCSIREARENHAFPLPLSPSPARTWAIYYSPPGVRDRIVRVVLFPSI